MCSVYKKACNARECEVAIAQWGSDVLVLDRPDGSEHMGKSWKRLARNERPGPFCRGLASHALALIASRKDCSPSVLSAYPPTAKNSSKSFFHVYQTRLTSCAALGTPAFLLLTLARKHDLACSNWGPLHPRLSILTSFRAPIAERPCKRASVQRIACHHAVILRSLAPLRHQPAAFS